MKSTLVFSVLFLFYFFCVFVRVLVLSFSSVTNASLAKLFSVTLKLFNLIHRGFLMFRLNVFLNKTIMLLFLSQMQQMSNKKFI